MASPIADNFCKLEKKNLTQCFHFYDFVLFFLTVDRFGLRDQPGSKSRDNYLRRLPV